MGYRSEREERLLQQLLDKYQTLGIVVWGQIEGAPNTYAKILVKSDGTVKVEGVITISGTVDVSDRWARQLGQVDIARYLGSAIGIANPLHSQIVVSGVVIDPRSIRALVKTTDELYSVLRTDLGVAYDARAVYGSQNQLLLQRAVTFELLATLRQGGSELSTSNPIFAGIVDAAANRMPSMDASTRPGYMDMIDRAGRLLGIIYGDQGQLAQRAATRDAYVQLRQAGSEIDPRLIQDVQKTVTVPATGGAGYLPRQAIAGGGTATIVNAPGVGFKLRLKRLQVSVDAITAVDLRWGATAFESYYLPANGTIIINKIGENFDGPANTALTILSTNAVNITASASTEPVAA